MQKTNRNKGFSKPFTQTNTRFQNNQSNNNFSRTPFNFNQHHHVFNSNRNVNNPFNQPRSKNIPLNRFNQAQFQQHFGNQFRNNPFHNYNSNSPSFNNKNNRQPNIQNPRRNEETPMSISTVASRPRIQNNNRQNSYFQQTGPRNFISEELFNVESKESPNNDVENVHIEASEQTQ